MKTLTQLAISTLAAGALLGALGSQAQTAVSELPLKSSVLAKPNVIFALDDSGSMDGEVLLTGTHNGMVYGMRTNATLFPSNQLRSNGDVRFDILFPTGTSAGNRVDDDNDWGPRALPPTAQFGWARSPDYNPIYYNPARTYEPWAPSFVGAAVKTYVNSPPATASTHPNLGSTTVKLDGTLTNNSTGWLFSFTAGMIIPSGSTNIRCNNGSNGTPANFTSVTVTLPHTVTTTQRDCTAAVPYYPATVWRKQLCTVNGVDCAAAWDGATVRRYEIKSGVTIPGSTRTYAQEMQNFANWFTYFRKRRLMAGSAMGDTLEYMLGMNAGVVNFNNRVPPTMFDLDSTSAANNRLGLTTLFYNAENSAATPTHATMAYVADQFDTNTSIVRFACQKNAMFVVTDGFANDAALNPAGYAAGYSRATYGAAAPYTAISTGSLHDKALAYYTARLRATISPLAAGKVPISTSSAPDADKNPNLHINTYAISIGAPGTIWPYAADPYVTAPTWPTPVDNTPTMIDDLYHATINGRGKMYLASDPAALAANMVAGLNHIVSQNAAQSGLAVSTVNLIRGDSRAYFGTYDPAGWRGDVKARAINSASGVVSTADTWSASTILGARDWTTRVIASHTGSAGVGFTGAGVGSLVNPGGVYGTTADVIAYLRGDRSREGTTFRNRLSLLGAIFNSEPAISSDGVLYVASGEGMLHAFDTVGADAGKELWAYVPRAVLPDIGVTVDRAYAFKTQLDGSPVLGTIGSAQKILVAGMGAAGRSYFALDVSTPRGLNESQLATKTMWEFPAAPDTTTQAKVGQTLGRPVIVRTEIDGWVVLVTSGYNNSDGIGRLWMLDADTGAVIKEFSVGVGTPMAESGLAHVSALEENDGTSVYAYGGDLLGNLWRFDLKAQDTPVRIATLRSATNAVQPVTTPPELTRISGQRVVIVPTGRLLHQSDFGSSAVQSIYAITDGATLSNARSSLVQMSFARGSPDSLTGNSIDWATQRGWYMDLPAGEQGNTRPTVTYGGVAFVTNKNGSNDCSAESWMYLVDAKTGKKHDGASFVSTQVSASSNAARATAVITQDATTKQNRAVGLVQDQDDRRPTPQQWAARPIPAAKTAWREVRR